MICRVEGLQNEIRSHKEGDPPKSTLLRPDQAASGSTLSDESRERLYKCAVHTRQVASAHVQYTHSTLHCTVPHSTALVAFTTQQLQNTRHYRQRCCIQHTTRSTFPERLVEELHSIYDTLNISGMTGGSIASKARHTQHIRIDG